MENYVLAVSQSNCKLLTLKLYIEYEYLIYSMLKENSLYTFQSTYYRNSILTVYNIVVLLLMIYVGVLITGISNWYF